MFGVVAAGLAALVLAIGAAPSAASVSAQLPPKGRWRTQISRGATEWNRYGRRLRFHPPSTNDPSVTHKPVFGCPTPENTVRPGVVYRTNDTRFADTFTCKKLSDGRPFFFKMFFRETSAQAPWWTDPKDNGNIPANKVDLQSSATHEFGHATGWGPHYDDNPKGPEYPLVFKPECRQFKDQTTPNDRPNGTHTQQNLYTGQQTMCSTISTGGIHVRKLGEHDRGTFRNAYPAG